MKYLSLLSFILSIIVAIIFIKSVHSFTILAERTGHHGSRVKKQLNDDDYFKEHRSADHKAFLGSDEEIDEFDHLSPEESQRRLTVIVEKSIDTNHDGNITEQELKEWIYKSQRRYIVEDVNRQWSMHTDKDPTLLTISWDKFRNKTYGFLDNIDPKSENDMKTYRDMLKRDERRWKVADQNGDNVLDQAEFTLFLHPEEDSRMHDVVVDETLEDIDRDNDERLSETEYISDLYSPEDRGTQYVPEWVSKEREQFRNYRDKNKDGFLDREEIRDWIVPTNYDHAQVEAKHLIHEADSDADGVLNLKEILEHYDVFVGSQATDFGDALTRHDEF